VPLVIKRNVFKNCNIYNTIRHEYERTIKKDYAEKKRHIWSNSSIKKMFCSIHSKNIKERNRNWNDASLSTTLLSMSILTQLVRVRYPFNAIWRKKESDNLEISPKRQTPSVGSYSSPSSKISFCYLPLYPLSLYLA